MYGYDNVSRQWQKWYFLLLTYCYKMIHVHVGEVTDEEKDEADEKNRLITQVLELQNTLDGE